MSLGSEALPSDRALTAVAVERAEEESLPVQNPLMFLADSSFSSIFCRAVLSSSIISLVPVPARVSYDKNQIKVPEKRLP